MAKQILFSTIDNSFLANPITGALGKKNNDDAIKQSIKNLVLSNSFERPFQGECTGNVTEKLFENMGETELHSLDNRIRTVIANYEKRAIVEDVIIRDDLDRNGFIVSVVFRPINFTYLVTVDVFLRKIR